MKQTLSILVALCLLISATAFAQKQQQPQNKYNLKGRTYASGHLGYAFGMGDAFSDYTDPFSGTEYSSDAGIGFGGQFYYGVKSNILIGGELLFQSYTAKLHSPPNISLGIPAYDVSNTNTETNLIANALFAVNQSPTSTLFFEGGTGFYDFGGMKLGLNTGVVWRKQVSNSVYLVGQPRLHLIMTDSTPMMIQLTMGAQFSL